MTPAIAPCTTTRLLPGECLHTAVDAGAVLLVTEGRVRIDEAPRWLDGISLPVGRTLGEGESCVITHAGWICVRAPGTGTGEATGTSACLRQWPAPQPPARQPLWQLMRSWIGG